MNKSTASPGAIQPLSQRIKGLAVAASLALTLAACGGEGDSADSANSTSAVPAATNTTEAGGPAPTDQTTASDSTAPPANGADSAYPLEIVVCGSEPVVFEQRPERVITTAPNITEYFLALGLGDLVVGHFGGDLPVSAFVEEYQTIEKFSVAFNLEEIVALDPDLIYAGFGFGFENGTALSPDGFADLGIAAIPLFGSCTYAENGENQGANAEAAGLQGNDLEATFVDIRTIGTIFDVADEAEALIAEMKETVKTVGEAVSDAERPSVFFYHGGDATPFSAGAISTPNALITLGGGEHIFADLAEDYTTVSWEAVVAANPDCVLIKNGDNAGNFGEDLITFLKTSPITSGLNAVANDCFFMLNQDHLTPGPLNAWAVQAVAAWLHPDLVDVPAPTP